MLPRTCPRFTYLKKCGRRLFWTLIENEFISLYNFTYFLLYQLVSIDVYVMSSYASIPSLMCLLQDHFIFQMSGIVSEQWIQIRHLEQALEMTKVCLAGVGKNLLFELLYQCIN